MSASPDGENDQAREAQVAFVESYPIGCRPSTGRKKPQSTYFYPKLPSIPGDYHLDRVSNEPPEKLP